MMTQGRIHHREWCGYIATPDFPQNFVTYRCLWVLLRIVRERYQNCVIGLNWERETLSIKICEEEEEINAGSNNEEVIGNEETIILVLIGD